MELQELQIAHRGPRVQGQRDAVPRGHLGVGGERVEVSRAAGGEHHVVGGQDVLGTQATRRIQGARGHARHGSTPLQDAGDQCVFLDTHASRRAGLPHPCREGLLDHPSGGITPGVQDPRHTVRPLKPLDPRGARPGHAVEGHAVLREQGDGLRGVGDDAAHHLRIAQPRSCGLGVPGMQLGGVQGLTAREVAGHGGNSALRPVRGGVAEGGLGQDGDPGAAGGGTQCGGESGGTGAHDEQARRGIVVRAVPRLTHAAPRRACAPGPPTPRPRPPVPRSPG